MKSIKTEGREWQEMEKSSSRLKGKKVLLKFNQNCFPKVTTRTAPAPSRLSFFDLHFSIFILCLPGIFLNFWFMKKKVVLYTYILVTRHQMRVLSKGFPKKLCSGS